MKAYKKLAAGSLVLMLSASVFTGCAPANRTTTPTVPSTTSYSTRAPLTAGMTEYPATGQNATTTTRTRVGQDVDYGYSAPPYGTNNAPNTANMATGGLR